MLTPAACCGSRARGAQQGSPSSGRGCPFGHGVVSCPNRFHCSPGPQFVAGCDSHEKPGSFGVVGSPACADGKAPAEANASASTASRRPRHPISRERPGEAKTCGAARTHSLARCCRGSPGKDRGMQMARRWMAAAIALIAMLAAASSAYGESIPNPAVEGPIEGGLKGYAWNHSLYDLRGKGFDYTENEYFF